MIIKKEKEIGGRLLSIETGRVARQANGAVLVRYADTMILAVAVCEKEPREDIDFFPLSVEYQEKTYAAGKIPGGFFKREGRPSAKEILSARLIDRPVRPLFPDNFKNETQVVVYVLSSDQQNDADVLGGIGASAALCISDIPFLGPIASVRVGMINGEFVINPTFPQLEESRLNLVLSGSYDSIIMVEGQSNELGEADMVAALKFGHQYIREIIDLQRELIAECGLPKMEIPEPQIPEGLEEKIDRFCAPRIREANQIAEKKARREAVSLIKDELMEMLGEELAEEKAILIKEIFEKVEKREVRAMVLNEGKRLDGRGLDDIREITCEVGFLPRAHGSALFTRGQTQSLGAATLGTKIDEQIIDALEGDSTKSYMLHYNFPGFSVGEVKFFRGPSRREIGHGDLAERSLMPVLPAEENFPYTIRIVSEILESNGSSSMASVCSGSLSLMDAGVPVKCHVAGIAMGLIKEDSQVCVLTDILGDEDHLGDMDFKVAGTRQGITAFQMDIKISGLTFEIMAEALEKARRARHKILDIMEKTIERPRADISPYAPRILTLMIPVDKIGAVIGPGGKVIRGIIEQTGAKIDIDDSGLVIVASADVTAAEKAKYMVQALVEEPEVGKQYRGVVKRIMDFGAFAEFLPGKEGLIHISELDDKRVGKVTDVVKLGDAVDVVLIKIDREGRYNLSRKEVLLRSQKQG
ncbi:MAG: polyribonucleotide nucleotidyltransferase [Calditrichaceae bacterium]|nr:polyribonucleotide nucleotidyltransferase [Calditrichia bacterium]NUQ43274.1 polyribonucleotide nucleotidyltransferase [Calditrichaceae bacterium]